MTTRVPIVFVMAYRDYGDAARQEAFAYVQDITEDLAAVIGAEIILADCLDPFTKPRALNNAIRRLPPGTVVIQQDPDSLLPTVGAYDDAILAAVDEPGLVIPHTRYLYLDADTTRAVLDDRVWLDELNPDHCEESGVAGVGNVTVFTRETWEQAGGYDERFPVWGGDDAAFAIASGALIAPLRRLPGDVIHLWHPRLPGSQQGNEDYEMQVALVHQYHAAADAGTMADLVASR